MLTVLFAAPDLWGEYSDVLPRALERAGIKAQVVQAGHTWGDDDLRGAQDWIKGVGND